jgi:uncharacterized protein (DUF111 family)
MTTPDPEALRFAAEWLREYEGDCTDGNEDVKKAASVADWLNAQADAADLRAVAKEHGVPVAKLRRRMKAHA